jgi:hypothetical protein
MAEIKKTPIVIDDVEYQFEDMSQEQQMLVNHIMDLERKISASRFNLDQMTVGKDAFIQMLKQSLEKKEEVVQ